MAEANELQVLDKISTEVDAAQIKVILATQCIKAQAFLVEKLKKQIQRNIKTCGYISSANLKLQSEITQAEQEIKSFYIAMETIRIANVELKKQWLVAKEKKFAVTETVESGENKYEKLWLECKSRYESLPYVQKLLKVAQTAHSLKDQITSLDKQAEVLRQEIQTKMEACVNVDRKRVLQLAQFLIHERPILIDEVNKKSKAITDMINKMSSLVINSNVDIKVAEKEKAIEVKNVVPEIVDEDPINDEIALIMPKLQSGSLDVDDLISVKLDQVKMKSGDYTIGLEKKESFSKSYFDIGTSVFNRKTAIDESISLYFSKPKHLSGENETPNYSKKKLINILEDVKIDSNNAMDMISKVIPGTLHPVDFIAAEIKSNENLEACTSKVKEPIQIEKIEDIDMTSSKIEDIDMTSSNEENNNIVKPPTQFLDGTLNTQKSQEIYKTVSFDLSVTSQNNAISEIPNKTDTPAENDINESSPENQLNVSDDGFAKIKDMVLKKHNLDSTPPFVYAKNTIQMKVDEHNFVTSKFFRSNENVIDETEQQENNNEIQTAKFQNKALDQTKDNSSKIIELDAEDDDMIISKNKKAKITDEMCNPDKPFSGYLFSHGPQGLPDSLDVSISTTGYEDGDDFPHCIDSSLLLSPKADIPMCTENPDVKSQEAPNFLSGLRKTGFSFFGHLPAGDKKPDSSAPNQGSSGFNFNFGGEEKKTRGGLFSMFQ